MFETGSEQNHQMTQETKPLRPKVLLVDDDQALLDTYSALLARLPSQPEIFTASSGARALSLLKAETFRLLICDLRMPRMDGLQVLSIVRRQWPELRTVVLTAVEDEQFRSRAYALGVDMFWLKPDSKQNLDMFLQCAESLLGREAQRGFRGVQSKTLLDLIQMESLSQSSAVLRIAHGSLLGRIWFESGELVDAETDGVRGEAAFRQILSWKSGTFETLAPEPGRERTIDKPVNALLLETAQAMDEVAAPVATQPPEQARQEGERKEVSRLASLTRGGADFAVIVPQQQDGAAEGWGTEHTQDLGGWVRRAQEICQQLSQELKAGPVAHLEGRSLNHRVVLLSYHKNNFLIGWPLETEPAGLKEQSLKLVASWES
jgi:DNA-binding NarL/FixJ family response regulator